MLQFKNIFSSFKDKVGSKLTNLRTQFKKIIKKLRLNQYQNEHLYYSVLQPFLVFLV
jgi:hypothetical protein